MSKNIQNCRYVIYKRPLIRNVKFFLKFIPHMWIMKNEADAIIACLHAKVDSEVVKIGPIAVREDYQATFFLFTFVYINLLLKM